MKVSGRRREREKTVLIENTHELIYLYFFVFRWPGKLSPFPLSFSLARDLNHDTTRNLASRQELLSFLGGSIIMPSRNADADMILLEKACGKDSMHNG